MRGIVSPQELTALPHLCVEKKLEFGAALQRNGISPSFRLLGTIEAVFTQGCGFWRRRIACRRHRYLASLITSVNR